MNIEVNLKQSNNRTYVVKMVQGNNSGTYPNGINAIVLNKNFVITKNNVFNEIDNWASKISKKMFNKRGEEIRQTDKNALGT